MKKSTDYKTHSNFGALFIGPPKSGKSRLAMSFPKPAVLDCDGNLAGAIRAGAADFLFEDPNVDDKGVELQPAMKWKKCCDFLREAINLPETECQTIVIDGLSIMSNYLIDSLSQNSKLTVGGEKVMDQSLWQPFRNRIQQFMLQGRASSKMFIVTCHEDVIKDDNSGAVVSYRPLIPGQLKQNLAGLFSDVWRCEAKALGNNIKYIVRFAPKNMMQIGNSLNIKEVEMELTDKSPDAIWETLKQYFA